MPRDIEKVLQYARRELRRRATDDFSTVANLLSAMASMEAAFVERDNLISQSSILAPNQMKKQTSSKPASPKRTAPTAPTKPGQAPAPTDPLGKLRQTLSTVIFQAEDRRNLAQGEGAQKVPTHGLDATIETLRYVWDAVEAATKL